jgi:hypothetical protein
MVRIEMSLTPPKPAGAFQYVGPGTQDDERVCVYRSHSTGLLHAGPSDRHGLDRSAPSNLTLDTCQ